MQICKKYKQKFAYIKKKQYLCSRFMQKRTYYIPTIEIMDLRAAGVMMFELGERSGMQELGAPARYNPVPAGQVKAF